MPSAEAAAGGVTWDLSDLYAGPDDPRIGKDLASILQGADAFAEAYRGRISAPGLDAATLVRAVTEAEALWEEFGILSAFAYLTFAADTGNPAHGALLTRVREAGSELRARMVFLELEWAALPDEAARPLLEDAAAARYRHHLIKERDFRPHLRTEGEEVILDLKANTGSRALARLFDEVLARQRFAVATGGETRLLTEEEALALLHNPDRETRRAAADGLTDGLRELRPVLTFIYNTLMADHAADDRIRAFEGLMAARNLDNEISQASVDALLAACERAQPAVHDYYRLKARLLGVEELYDYDRYAPVGEGSRIPFGEAREIVLGAFGAFSPRMADVARPFFERRWIDAELRDGKQGGAFSHPVVPSRHPYILMNYQGRPRDVMTLAHELGHGVHQWLARERGYFGSATPLTTAETASVFGEMLVFSALRSRLTDPKELLGLLCGKLEDTFSTVFRQVAMTRFEQAAHRARREQGELTAARIGALWMEANRPMFGDALTLRDDYALWWSYIPHFIHTPFYCYAYAFGELLVLALYARYLEEGGTFPERYLELLAAGGTDRPENLLKRLGVDITDPGFWDGGLAMIRAWVEEARACAGASRAGTG